MWTHAHVPFRVWDINTGVCLTSMSGHTANIKHLQAVTNRVVSSSNDNTCVCPLPYPCPRPLRRSCYCARRDSAGYVSIGRLVEWDTRTYAQVRSTYCTHGASSQRAYAAVSAFHYDPDRDLIVLGHREGTVQRSAHARPLILSSPH
jgi:hypothetical protein